MCGGARIRIVAALGAHVSDVPYVLVPINHPWQNVNSPQQVAFDVNYVASFFLPWKVTRSSLFRCSLINTRWMLVQLNRHVVIIRTSNAIFQCSFVSAIFFDGYRPGENLSN